MLSNCRYDTGQPQSRSSPQSISVSPVRVVLLHLHPPIPPEQSTPSSGLALSHTPRICASITRIKRVLGLTAHNVLLSSGIDGHIIQNDCTARRQAPRPMLRPLQTQHIKWVTTVIISVTQLQCACLSFSLPLKSLECKQVKLRQGGNKIRMRNGEGKGKHPTVLVWRLASSQLQRAGSPELGSWSCCRNKDPLRSLAPN